MYHAVAATAWEHWGGDLNNRRWGSSETTISPDNAGSLTAKWTYDTAGDVSATPTVVGGRLYVPDWNGLLHCVDAATGACGSVAARRCVLLACFAPSQPHAL